MVVLVVDVDVVVGAMVLLVEVEDDGSDSLATDDSDCAFAFESDDVPHAVTASSRTTTTL
jgi:hypothetical protein